MRKSLFPYCIAFCCINAVHGQSTAVPPIIHSQTTLNRLTKAGGFNGSEVMRGIPPPPVETLGSPYLDDQWHVGTVMLYQGDALIERVPLKYDLEKQVLEIYDGRVVKILESSKIKSFVWVKESTEIAQYFVNAQDFDHDGTTLIGFFEVLADGVMSLFRKTELTLQKANYVKEFDTGSRNDKLVKNDFLYYAEEKKVTRLPRRKINEVFKTDAVVIEKFVEELDLDYKKIPHLVLIFDKYNSINNKP